jgi:hypothetical protein
VLVHPHRQSVPARPREARVALPAWLHAAPGARPLLRPSRR